jgi:Zn-dependent protease
MSGLFDDPLGYLSGLILKLPALLIAVTVHELAHALVADRLGDPTARRLGRITLNPLPHIDPLGALAFILAGFGWAKPVPVNPTYLRYGPRLGMLIVSLAGPLANLLLAILFAIPVRLGLVGLSSGQYLGFIPYPSTFFFWAIYLNILLLFFNLLPIAPLDGFAVLAGLLPADLAYRFEQTRQWGMFILMGLVLLGSFGRLPLLNLILDPPMNAVFYLLTGRSL